MARRSPTQSDERPTPATGEIRAFVVTCALYLALVGALSAVFLSDYVFDDLLAGLRGVVAEAAGGAFELVGFPIRTHGDVIRGPGAALLIVNECTGIDATILLVAAVLVFPAAWSARLLGVVLSLAAMMLVNFVRVLTLVYLGNYAPELLEVGHLYVWPVIVIIVGVSTLVFWAERYGVVRS